VVRGLVNETLSGIDDGGGFGIATLSRGRWWACYTGDFRGGLEHNTVGMADSAVLARPPFEPLAPLSQPRNPRLEELIRRNPE
jgi:hypothetical protein